MKWQKIQNIADTADNRNTDNPPANVINELKTEEIKNNNKEIVDQKKK